MALPFAPLSSSAGVTWGSVRGSQDHLWTIEAPTAVLEASLPGPFHPQKPRESRGQGPPPVFPLLSLSKLRTAGVRPRTVSATSPGRAVRAVPHKGMRVNCDCGYGSTSRGSTLPQRKPKSLLRTFLLHKSEGPLVRAGAPLQPRGGPWEGNQAGCLISTQKPCSH